MQAVIFAAFKNQLESVGKKYKFDTRSAIPPGIC